jgi:outer membrane biosynthesis protein TonB
MNRTQKKCLIASTGLHLLLAVILIVGPAFLSSKDQYDNSPVLTFVPIVPTDDQPSGGGNPKAQPPPVAPPEPPQPVKTPEPKPVEPVKAPEPAPPKIQRVSPDAFEPVKEPKHKIDVDTTVVKRDTKDYKAAKAAADAKASADVKQRANEINRALANI